jgi:hypothetical protein
MRLPPRLALASLATLSCTTIQPTAPDSPSTPVARVEGGPIVLAGAQRSDLIVIQVASQGCFHNWVVDLNIQRRSDDVFDVTARASTRYRPDIGTTTVTQLSLRDITQLDRYLHLYRTVSSAGFCTTHTQVRVSRVHGGVVQRSESMEDTSCEVYSRARGDLPVAFNSVLEAALDELYADLRHRLTGA